MYSDSDALSAHLSALSFTARGKLIAKACEKRGISLGLPWNEERAAQRFRITQPGEHSPVLCPSPPLWEALCESLHHVRA